MEIDKLNRLAKKVVPDGFKLEKDRSRNAKIVLDPDNPAQLSRWKKATNRTDLKGFDTKKEKTLSVKQVLSKQKVGYIESDPDRIVRQGHVTRELIDSISDKIVDRESMIKEVTAVWKKDKSLNSFWDGQHWLKKSDWEALFNTDHMKNIIRKNTILPVLKTIQKQFNVDIVKAKNIYDKMPDDKKATLLKRTSNLGRLKEQIQKPQPKVKPIQLVPLLKRQKSRVGKFYRRAKPQKWTQIQKNFLNNYSNEKIDVIIKIYNNSFSKKRTMIGLKTKLYRMKKSGEVTV